MASEREDLEFALSTHWNAHRHIHGEAMLEEILALGFRSVELGYDLRIDLVPGVKKLVEAGTVKVTSLHNFCPVPIGAPRGHPELYTLAASDKRERQNAVHYTSQTLRFAAEVGAKYIVVHSGNVEMDLISRQLFDMYVEGQLYTDQFEKVKLKMQVVRDRKVPKQLEYLNESLDKLLPVIAETGVKIALENLPTWESIPTEVELEVLMRKYFAHGVCYWHDMGHAQIRQNLGLINVERWMDRLQPYIVGMHVHDVHPPASDHVMPPLGQIRFERFQKYGTSDIVRVIEPTTKTPADEIVKGLAFLKSTWGKVEDAQGATERSVT
jgi:sugar phosphate isomerase/epimerase